MNTAHVHLLLNHVPVVGSMLAVLLLAVALGRRSSELGKVALGGFVLLAATALAVFFTGEPAEATVEKLPGFSEAITERHEEMALIATVALSGVGALALLVLAVFRKRPLPRWVTAVVFVMSVGIASIMGYTANLGGQVRHTEIRSGQTVGARGELIRESDRRER